MPKAAIVASSLSLLLAACVDGIEEPPADPTTPMTATVLSSVPGHELVIATGGAVALRIEDKRALGLEGNASDGFTVSPYESDRWPHISTDYLVFAQKSGIGSYEIITSKGIASGLVHSAAIDRVELRPARYELDGTSPFALAPNRTQVEVALLDARGRRLVDAMLAIAGADQTDWDRATIASPVTGRHTLTVHTDALERTFEVDVTDGVDRVERVRNGNRTCFHAYAGSTEIAVTMSFERGTQDPNATNCATTATNVSPDDVRVRF